MTCASTSLRMSVMARCAATPRICELANDVTASTMVAAADGHRQLRQQVPVLLADDVVHQVLGRRRQDEAGQAVDDHHRQAERRAGRGASR